MRAPQLSFHRLRPYNHILQHPSSIMSSYNHFKRTEPRIKRTIFSKIQFLKITSKNFIFDFCDESSVVRKRIFHSQIISSEFRMGQTLIGSFYYTINTLEAPLSSKRTEITIKRTKFLKIYYYNNTTALRCKRK